MKVTLENALKEQGHLEYVELQEDRAGTILELAAHYKGLGFELEIPSEKEIDELLYEYWSNHSSDLYEMEAY